jgi:hypothetical protein
LYGIGTDTAVGAAADDAERCHNERRVLGGS